MDIIIRFIGVILLYQSPDPHRAIIPRWDNADNEPALLQQNFCGFRIQEHQPYVRVSKFAVLNDSKWPKYKDCEPGLDCVVYTIPDQTSLSIDFGGSPTMTTKEPVPCFIPDLEKEHMVEKAVLHKDALAKRSTTDYVLPNGHLVARQFANDQIYTMLTVPVAVARHPKPVRVLAISRKDGSVLRELRIQAGATIDILDVPPHHAVIDYNTINHDQHFTELDMKGHAFFVRKLLDNPVGCALIHNNAPESCGSLKRNHFADLGTTQDLGCGTLTASGDKFK